MVLSIECEMPIIDSAIVRLVDGQGSAVEDVDARDRTAAVLVSPSAAHSAAKRVGCLPNRRHSVRRPHLFQASRPMADYHFTAAALLFTGEVRSKVLRKPGRTKGLGAAVRAGCILPHENDNGSIVSDFDEVEILEARQALKKGEPFVCHC